MEDSLPLRRSTRNSVVLKNEELTPRKKKVSTPVKVEPSTPSRRTRASSATPKKNLIEVMNTPKKTLPVLNEEENAASSTRTPVKKSKEISPKTPSRRRTVRESVSTPTRTSMDKSIKKPVETSEELNISTSGRPLTRAKRKTMGEIQTAEITKTSESEKVTQKKKEKAESDKGLKNEKEKPTASDNTENISNISPDSNSDKKTEESCFALVPRVLVTDIKKEQLKKEAKDAGSISEENECGVFTSKSPVRAEDIAINSPRKVPENCKSISEASLKTDSEYIKSRSQKSTVDPENSISSLESTDVSSVEKETSNSSFNTKSDIVATSSKKTTDSKDNDVPNIVITSPSLQKIPDSKSNDIPNIVVTSPSPQKAPVSKDNYINGCDGTVTSKQRTSPRKNKTNSSTDVKEKEIKEPSKPEKLSSVSDATSVDSEMTNEPDREKLIKLETELSSENKDENSKFSIEQNIEVSENSQMKINDKSSIEETDGNSKIIVHSGADIASPSKADFQDKEDKEVKSTSLSTSNEAKPVSINTQSPKKVDLVENMIGNEKKNENNSVEVVMQVSNDEIHVINEADANAEISQIKNKDGEESNKTFEKVFESKESIPDSAECITAKGINAEKSAESDLQVLQDENISEPVLNKNDSVTKDDVIPIENESNKDTKESELINTADETFKLDTSFLKKSNLENNSEEADVMTSSISVAKEAEMEVGKTQTQNKKNEKDEELNIDEASSSSPGNSDCSTKKGICSEVSSPEASGEDEKVSTMIQNNSEKDDESSQNNSEKDDESSQNNSEKDDESSKESTDESSPVRSSPVKPNDSSSPKPSHSAQPSRKVEVIEFGGPGNPTVFIENPDNLEDSPVMYVRCDCETSDDSGDSGIHNDDSVIIFKMSSQYKKHITVDQENSPKDSTDETKKDISKHEGSIVESRGNDSLCEVTVEKDEVRSLMLESSASDVKLSPAKSDSKHSPEKSDVKISPAKLDITLSPGKSDAKLSPTKSDSEHSLATSDIKNSPEKSDVKLSPEKSDAKLSPEKSDAKLSPEKSDTKNKNEDSASKIIGLDAILMSPKDFLNSDDESNLDCEKIEDSESKNGREYLIENKPSVKPANPVDHPEHSILDATLSNEPPEGSPTKFDEKQDSDVVAKSAVDEVEKDVTVATLSDDKNEIIPINSDTLLDKDTSVDQEKEEIFSQKYSEEENYEGKNSTINISEDNQTSEKKPESPSVDDIKKLNTSKLSDSLEENEREVFKNATNVRDNAHSSQIIGSPEVEAEKSLEDGKSTEKSLEDGKSRNKSESELENSVKGSDSSEAKELDIKANLETIKKNTRIKNRKKKIDKKVESETESSQSDADSELSSDPPSNAATEGSSDGPLTGRDFIDFEAEEGEETSEDDSFIVSDSTESSSSDKPRFAMKLRKRKRNLDTESSDSCNYIDSVQRLFDNSEDISMDDRQQDSSVKNKKQKLEKVSINRKNKRPKSVLRNKRAIFESEENRNTNKIKTENKVIKEPTKTGVFIVSSISQCFEEPKLSRNISKRSSKLRMEQKKSEISDLDFVPKGFGISGVGEKADDAALRGFVVSYDDSYLVTKKARKAVNGGSESLSKKKKFKEVQKIKKTIKKSSINSESKGISKSETASQFVVTLILPFSMTLRSVTSVLTDLGLSDISSINFPKPRVAIVKFSNKESYKKILKLYGELKINDRPIYILEGSSLF